MPEMEAPIPRAPSTQNAAENSPDFRSLFEAAPGLYLALTPELKIVAVSNAYLRATRSGREEIVGRNLFEFLPNSPEESTADNRQALRASLLRVIEHRAPDAMPVQRYDLGRTESEGGGLEQRYWSQLNSPILGKDGEVAYILHRVEDVTEFMLLKSLGKQQDKLGEQLRLRSDQMEAEIYCRAQELNEANRKLREANEELARMCTKCQELDQLKSELFANISHELRTPLALILGPVSKRIAEGEQAKDLRMVERNARLLLRHVNDLLDLSKLDSGHMLAEYAQTDLAQLTRMVAANFEPLATDREIHFTIDAVGALPAEIDPHKVERILVNLLSNAFRFTPCGGRVELRLACSGVRALIEVEDNGPGIRSEQRETLFERFRQSEGGLARKAGGTGLGLAIVKEFVLLHGGNVSVTTPLPGTGSLFRVELPLHAPEGASVRCDSDDPELQIVQQALEEIAPWHSTSGEGSNVVPLAPSILLVEDNRDMSAFVAGVLSKKYRVFCAFDGREGLEKALSLRPDLILSDVMLPRMSGDQLLAELRRRPEFDDTPVMLLTAVADEQLRLKLLHDGAQDYLQKPFEPAEVLARAARLIADRLRSAHNMQAQEQRLAAIIRSAMDAIITVDAEQRIVMFNGAAEETFGCTAEEAIGQPLDIFIPDQYRKAHRDYVDRFGATGKTTRSMHSPASLQALRKDGTIFPIEATISQATIQGNKLYTVILRDVTQRRQTEAALVQSQKLASLGRFAATLAHEINNPLESVLNLLYLAQLDGAVGPDARTLLKVAGEEIERAIQIARQTLGFSRGGTRISRFRPAQAMESVIALLAPKLRNKQIECETELASYQEIEGVESEIRQVFWNLLTNSLDALPQGGRIRVRVGNFPTTGSSARRIRITIADNGCGIPRERATSLFEPFQTTKETGNGLGLWVSKQVVKKHRGSITVRSRSGTGRTGTIFSIILPAKVAVDAEASRATHATAADFAQTRGA